MYVYVWLTDTFLPHTLGWELQQNMHSQNYMLQETGICFNFNPPFVSLFKSIIEFWVWTKKNWLERDLNRNRNHTIHVFSSGLLEICSFQHILWFSFGVEAINAKCTLRPTVLQKLHGLEQFMFMICIQLFCVHCVNVFFRIVSKHVLHTYISCAVHFVQMYIMSKCIWSLDVCMRPCRPVAV